MHLFMPPKWHFQLQHILNERLGQLPKTTETTWSDELHFQMMRSWRRQKANTTQNSGVLAARLPLVKQCKHKQKPQSQDEDKVIAGQNAKHSGLCPKFTYSLIFLDRFNCFYLYLVMFSQQKLSVRFR